MHHGQPSHPHVRANLLLKRWSAIWGLNILSNEVFENEVFMSLCPNADDIWLHIMGRRAGAVYRKTVRGKDVVNTFGSQKIALWQTNIDGGNDQNIVVLAARYGWPK